MQKKIIALAIAGLASTAAFAQSNVTIYGSVDYGYAYRDDARKDAGAPKGTADSSSRVDSGQQGGNRLGFKGVEDLGNGLKAVFLMEQGFNLDTGAAAGNANTSGNSVNVGAAAGYTRQAYMGLAGGFGTLIGGRLYTPHYSFVSTIDPFGAGTVGRYNNVYGGDVNALLDPLRVDNAVAYVSPSFGGFNVTAAYANNAIGGDSVLDNSQNNTVYALLGRYTAGAVDVGLSYHLIAAASDGLPARDAVKNVQNYTLGGTFDAKVVKIAALYSNNKIDIDAANSDVKIDNYLVGLTVPFGKAAVKASYMLSDGNTAAGGNAQQYAIGADYSLSKRTNLYSAYSLIDNDGTRRAGTGDATNSGFGVNATSTTLAVPYQQGFQVGVRHQF